MLLIQLTVRQSGSVFWGEKVVVDCEEKVNILKWTSFWVQAFVQRHLAKVWSNSGSFSAQVKFYRVAAIIKGIENGTLGAVFVHSLIYSISMFSLVFYNEKGVLCFWVWFYCSVRTAVAHEE